MFSTRAVNCVVPRFLPLNTKEACYRDQTFPEQSRLHSAIPPLDSNIYHTLFLQDLVCLV